tara:strand:+ start:13110 stop:15863 length:2754 start_codon:yes stop_codon:yes gene_type:complete
MEEESDQVEEKMDGAVVVEPEEKSSESSENDTSEEDVEESSEGRSSEKFDSDMDSLYVHKQVKSVMFSILSPKMIRKMASAKVVTPELYDKEGYPVDGGLMDIRLGVIDPGLRCKTCSSKLKECIGHFGYIEMARPVIHIKFVNILLTLLKCTCRDCTRILIPSSKIPKLVETLNKIEKDVGVEGRRKYIKDIITKLKTTSKCPNCKAKQQKITLEKPTTFLEGETRLSPIDIRAWMEKISDEDCEIFGLRVPFVRPEWMILTILAVPPVTMRPSITLESGERSEDDLTHKMGDIVRINQRLFENINAGAPEIIVEDLWDLLQYHITTFIDNAVAQLPPARHRSGQPLKTLTERIKSKEGRIRHNLAGKRVNFSARTVISPDPYIKLNEVGIPSLISTKLTVPERVTEWNKEFLKKFVENGPTEYPGANYIIRPDGKKKKITEETKEASVEELQPGYLVERHLRDGDVVLFNRQPSLHRMSMMCHRVKILPGKTLRLNPAVCTPYNADFDGDEMNLHVPQTEEARSEAEILMEVQTQLISLRYGLAIIGCTQDSISGNFLLTLQKELTREDGIDILASIGVEDFSKFTKKSEVSGKEIFSMLLPDDFDYEGHSRLCNVTKGECNEKTHVKIEGGKMVGGVIDKNSIGGESGIMLRSLHKKYGEDFAVDSLGKFFKLGIEYLTRKGFTSAISDTDLPEDAKQIINETYETAKKDVDNLIDSFKEGNLELLPGKDISETVELRILEVLNKTRNEIGNLVGKYANKYTHTMVMANSGARGNLLNLAQMAACVGQQAMRGKRIEKGYKNRTLSAFTEGDLSPDARGFITNGFKNGMNPSEFYFGSITGRDSLMDTALRTPKSGYLYRRLANALQDLKVDYDNCVRDAAGKIVQFDYGEDGIDVSKSENGVINVKNIIKSVA